MRRIIPKPLSILARIIRSHQKTPIPLIRTILLNPRIKASPLQRVLYIRKFIEISEGVLCGHTQQEISQIFTSVLALPPTLKGCIVEAGSYQGGSGAKISIAARKVDRRLIIFDSFKGIPPNKELKDDGKVYHPEGSWQGTLDQVKQNITRFGAIEVCDFIEGWFDDTMPSFSQPIAIAFLDVDLVASTRTCLKHLYPLISPGGILFSHDGHLDPVRKLYDDDLFWQNEVGCPKPHIQGLGERKLLKIIKPTH